MTGGVIIRAERPGDYPAIHDVHVAAFGQEDEARLVEALRSRPDFAAELSLVAESAGRVEFPPAFDNV